MKNLSLILNGLLLLLVANLYYQGCAGKKVVTDSLSKVKTDSTGKATVAPLKIAYVNEDTLLDKYIALKDQKTSLEKRYRDADASLREKGRQLQKDMLSLQETAQKGTVPPAQLQQEEQRLSAQQQNLMGEQQKKEKELSEEMRQINENLHKRVTDILNNLKKERGYDFVFSFSRAASSILIANESMDVTQEVLAELNKK